MPTLLEVENLFYKYPVSKDWVLKEINLRIDRGEFIVATGRTGAGKTTLMMTFNGLVPHYTLGEMKGHVFIDGIDTKESKISELSSKVGLVFQDPEGQLITSSVRDEILFGLRARRFEREEALSILNEVSEIMGIKDLLDRHPRSLSGGQKQRVAIASVLALKPDVIIIDEATSDLDPIGVRTVFEACRDLHKKHGKTIIMVTHEMDYAAEYASRLIVLSNGMVVIDDEIRKGLERYEELRSYGVRIPQMVEVYFKLKDLLNGQGPPLTIEEMKKVLEVKVVGSGRDR